MKLALVLVAALFAGCRSSGSSGDGAQGADAAADPRGDPAVEERLELADARLERGPAGVEAVFVLRNRSDEKLSFEFRVQSYGRSGAPLQGGRTAWVLLELDPREGREVRTAILPAQTESWRLVARKKGG